MEEKIENPLPQEIEEARKIPNGWVYRIAGKSAPMMRCRTEAIVGAWKVDSSGKIVGKFITNARYDPNKYQ